MRSSPLSATTAGRLQHVARADDSNERGGVTQAANDASRRGEGDRRQQGRGNAAAIGKI